VSATTRDLQRVAAETFGWHELRPEQLTAMEAVAAGRDVLAVLPTGAGKSAIYQVPAVLQEGPTLIVSPLVALQRDQRTGIAERADGEDAPEAVVINSVQRAEENRQAWEVVDEGGDCGRQARALLRDARAPPASGLHPAHCRARLLAIRGG